VLVVFVALLHNRVARPGQSVLRIRGCIDAILVFRDQVRAQVVCGNHEDWMLRTMGDYSRHSWFLGMQPLDTIRSYSQDAARALRKAAREAGLQLFARGCELLYRVFFDAMPPAHRAFFEGRSIQLRGLQRAHNHDR